MRYDQRTAHSLLNFKNFNYRTNSKERKKNGTILQNTNRRRIS